MNFTSVQTQTRKKPSLQHLTHLPTFAGYILKQKLREFAEQQIQLSREFDMPLLKVMDLNGEQLYSIVTESSEVLLNFLVENRASEHIRYSIDRWLKNQLPKIDKYAVVAEDINLAIYIRKRAFLHFIPGYCSDVEKILELIREIDLFCFESEMATTNTYFDILNEKIEEHSHFIEKITNTSPGIIYVYDVQNNREIYANKTTTEFLGYTPEEIKLMGDEFVTKLIHPDDIENLKTYEKEFSTTADGEIRSFKYRIRNNKNEYHWLRTYETVFKRDGVGKITQKIGIAIDVHQQKITADALQKREQELLEAQEISQLGSFTWDYRGNESSASPQVKKILEADITDFNSFLEKVYEEDREKVQQAMNESATSGSFECEYRYSGHTGIKVLWTKGIVRFEDGKPAGMSGTVMDITEKSAILNQLRENEKLYKQAEALTHLGSYTWNVKTNEITWSDELYRIHGLDPAGERITFEKAFALTLPEDIEHARTETRSALRNKQPLDFYYRIQPTGSPVKILHARGNFIADSSGEVALMIGTSQDVTEKQELIGRLKRNEFIYKQAEGLANMGNWSWDLHSNKMDWTPQLYRIYGMEPDSEEITVDVFLSMVHPEDRARVSESIQEIFTKDILDDTFRIITRDGKLKILRSVAQVQKDENGKPAFVIGTERDITEKQTLIDRLRSSEKLYKQAQALAHVGNWKWDIAANRIEWSDELFRIYGLEPQSKEIKFEDYLEMIHPQDRDLVTTQVAKAREGKHSWEFTHRLIRSNDEVRIVSARGEVITDENGEPLMMIGTAQDVTDRQLLIEQLQNSEALYKQAQNLARIGNWSMDLKTNTFEWSEEMYKIYEVSREEKFDFTTWVSFILPEERTEVVEYYQACIREKKLYDKVHHIQLRDGRIKTIHRKGEFVLNETGDAWKMVGTTQDVTEEYRVQQELKENQMFIRKITDATPSIISSYNVNTGKYVFISEGLEKLLGYTSTVPMEQGVEFFVSLVHPDDLPELMEKNSKAVEEANQSPEKNDMVVEFVYRMRHKNGNYRWFHTYGTIFDRSPNNTVEHVLNISLDVTEQIEASKKIKEQEHFIQQIADASPTILYLFDVKSQSIEYINREIFFVLGYLPEEILNAKDNVTELLFHPEDFHSLPGRKQSSKTFQQVDSMMQYECRMKNKDGEWRWLLVREIVFKTEPDGSISQILGAALDINRRKEMEKTILQNTLLLEQSNASLEEFAYVASHDLKEPLRKISTFGDRLISSQMESLAPEGRLYLQKIVDASHRMQTMISDLLSISLISGNTAFENYSMKQILQETIQTLEFKIENLNADIEFTELPETLIIPSQFRQLFLNLLSNSLKFTRPGVQPRVSINHAFLSPHELKQYQLSQADQYLKLEFADNGIGFENEFAGKIFAIFQRLHGRSEYEGSGIGLSICKKIVEHHGGIIFADGTPDEGARFTIIMPHRRRLKDGE